MKRVVFYLLFAQSLAWASTVTYGPKATSKDALSIFLDVLSEHEKFPKEYYRRADNIDPTPYKKFNARLLKTLSPTVLQARMNSFNSTFIENAQVANKYAKELEILEARIKETALSEYKKRSDLELKAAALSQSFDQAKFTLFLTSINANMSVDEAVKTLSPDKLALSSVQELAKAQPKLPGVYGGSAAERRLMKEADKINLTPVDPGFYSTQLGQKLEKDFGARVDFWSYDYGNDELYVAVKNEVAKVNVFEDQGGIRFMRTRAGSAFNQMKNEDTRIDMLTAKGRFLTGDKREETLFGKMPPQGPALKDELPPGHSYNDGHDHGPNPNKHDHDH